MFSSITSKSLRKTRGAFSLVEILIVIMIIAVLMAVAIPNLLSSRDSGADSAAKQLLTKVSMEFKSVGIANESFAAINTKALATARIPGIAITDGVPGIVDGTNARQVSMYSAASTPTIVVLSAKGGGDHCYAMVLYASGSQADKFYSVADSTQTCEASKIPTPAVAFVETSNWSQYAFKGL